MIPSLFSVLLEAVFRALIAGVAVWGGLRLLRVKNLLAQKAAWGLVLMAGVAMPLLMRWQWVPAWALVKLPAPSWMNANHDARISGYATAVPVMKVSAPDPAARPIGEDAETQFGEPGSPYFDYREPSYTEPGSSPAAPTAPQAANTQATTPTSSNPTSMARAARLLEFGWSLYLGVCGVLLIRLFWGLASSLRLWIEAKPVEERAKLDFPASIRVCWSARVSSPVNIASGILLPADYAEWDNEKLRVVLAHEHSHIRQHDFYLQLLAGMYTAFTWFSPLGWWLKHKLSELSEAISDHAGLNAAKSPSAYAGLLLEFAALPRPTLNGVAMAHSKNLSQRIERLLNDASFRLAFAGGRRALLALVIPAALIAVTAMVRVQAATVLQPASSSQTGTAGQSNPAPMQVSDARAPQAPEAAPVPSVPVVPAPDQNATPEAVPAAPAPPAPAAGPQEPTPEMAPMSPMAPMPHVHVNVREPHVHVDVRVAREPEMARAYAFAVDSQDFDFNGSNEAYAIIGDPGSKPQFYGEWDIDRDAAIENARKAAHGHFLLFRHEGKTYIVDDPAIVSQVEDMVKARQDLSAQMRALGKQMHEAAQQASEQARKARETAASIPTPDLSKEIAALDASAASLKEKQGGTVSREQLQEMQREVMEIQRRLIQAEYKINFNMNDFWKNYGGEQGKLGSQMGELGSQIGRTARENHEKMKSIIDESLKNGKARPVE